MAKFVKYQNLTFLMIGILMPLLPSVLSQDYPLDIKTDYGGQGGRASVDLKNFDNLDLISFSYVAQVDMGSTAKINITGSTKDGNKTISNGRQGGEGFTRLIVQKVTKWQDAKFIHLTVAIQTILKYPEDKEKSGNTSIGVRVSVLGPHHWAIKHDYSNNYDDGSQGTACVGCTPVKPITPVPTLPTPTHPTLPPPELDHKAGNPFAYKWGVDYSPSQNLYSSDVDSDGENVRGEYRTLMPDGRTQIVSYTADWKNGYMPVVRYE